MTNETIKETADIDPYRIAASNLPPERPAIDETSRLKEVVVIVREDEDEEEDATDGPIGDAIKPIAGAAADKLKSEATGLVNRTLILLFAAAAFLVILFALLLASGSGGDSVVYCRDLPDWNQTADCL